MPSLSPTENGPSASPSLTPTPATTPDPTDTTTPASNDSFWIIGSPDESLSAQVGRAVSEAPEQADEIQDVLTQMQSNVEEGTPVAIPGGGKSTSSQLAELNDAIAVVNGAESSPDSNAAASTSSYTGAVTFTLASYNSKVSEAQTTDSSADYTLRGYTINDSHTWQVQTEIDAAECNPGGCVTHDRAQQTWKISPGITGDRFSFSAHYLQNEGDLDNLYADLSVVCGRTVCGTGDAGKSGPRDGSGSGNPVVKHDSQKGGTTVDRVSMHARLVQNGFTYYDKVKTGTARCTSDTCTF